MRPVGVTVLAVLHFVGAIVMAFVAILLFLGTSMAASSPSGATILLGLGVFGIVLVLLFAVLGALLGWGLWNLKNWARLVVLIISALGVVATLMNLVFTGIELAFVAGYLIRLAYYALVIWYLLRPHVKLAFGAARPGPHEPQTAV